MDISSGTSGDEGADTVGGGGGCSGGSAAAVAGGTPRWNPTKEQIGILEGMYKQGIRTPTAEQIQQITTRLRDYGHIEGKNVFYWFQNHKARQRQKQKQDSLAFLSRYFHHRSRTVVAAGAAVAPFPPPCPNVICGPYYMPTSEFGLYPIHPKVLLPCGIKRRQRPDTIQGTEAARGQKFHSSSHCYDHTNYYDFPKRAESNALGEDYETTIAQTTLDLFPLRPTSSGVTEDRNTNEITLSAPRGSSEVVEGGSTELRQAYFDFFSES